MGKEAILLTKEIYYPVLACFGVPANLVTIVILSRGSCGLSKCISVYMLGMALADLLVMIVNVLVYYTFIYHFPLSFLLHTPVCRFILYLTTITLDMSVWFTISFTFDRCVAICSPGLKTRYCTKRTAAIVLTTFTCVIVFKDDPVLFTYETMQIIGNAQWGCKANARFAASPFGSAFLLCHVLSLGPVPYTLIFLFNSLTVRRILAASRSRMKLRGNKSANEQDPEVVTRRKSIILLFAISGSFVLLWITALVSFLSTGLTNINSYRGDRVNPAYIATEVGAMLKYLSSCTNTCIYAATQSKFRAQLKEMAKSPWGIMLKLVGR